MPAVVCKAIKKRVASQMGPGLEEQSEGCAAGVGSLSLDVWYVMKPRTGLWKLGETEHGSR